MIIGTTYFRTAYLRPEDTSRFRALLSSYTRLRLQAYAYQPDTQARVVAAKRSIAIQDELWDIASKAGQADPGNVQLGLLTDALNKMIDASNELTVADVSHLPGTVIALILIVTFAAAFMLGLTFGRARTQSISMAIVFSALFAIVIFAIVDLDRPERGVVNVNLAPLQAELEIMAPHPARP